MSEEKSFMDYSKEVSFYFEFKDKEKKEIYKGNFSVKRPTIGDQIQIQRDISRVKGGVEKIEPGFETILFMLCYCRYVITDAPKWYYDSNNGEDLYDASIITELFIKIQDIFDGKKESKNDKSE